MTTVIALRRAMWRRQRGVCPCCGLPMFEPQLETVAQFRLRLRLAGRFETVCRQVRRRRLCTFIYRGRRPEPATCQSCRLELLQSEVREQARAAA